MTAQPSSEGSDRTRDASGARASDASSRPDSASEGAPDRCYRHPMRETLVRCTRCDRPICPDCMRPASVGFHCPDDVKLANRQIRVARTPVGAPVTQAARPPYVTWGVIGLNVVIFVITVVQSGRGINNPHGSSLFQNWFLSPYLVAHNHQFDRLIESAFLHENLIHIVVEHVRACGSSGPTSNGCWAGGATPLCTCSPASVAASRSTPSGPAASRSSERPGRSSECSRPACCSHTSWASTAAT